MTLVPTMATMAEHRLALAIEAARLGCWTWDMASGTTTWDERLEEMHGMAPGGFGGTFEDWMCALHPDDRAECVARVDAALASPGPYVLLHRTTWPDGTVHTIECRGTVLVDDNGRPTGTTGVAIDVTWREHLVKTLQHALLPATLPTVAGVDVAARYRASQASAGVGGDWFAVVPMADGRLGLAIGDVVGHGLAAVADMAATRFSLRALALTEVEPVAVLSRLNEVVRVFERDTIVTSVYGVLDPAARTWTYASAGHLPAVVREGGRTRLLDEPNDPPLGVATGFRVREAHLAPGATLVLCTDGLIERRAASLADGFRRLLAACAVGPAHPQALCDHLVDALLDNGTTDDDVAVLAVTLTDETRGSG